MVKKEIKKKPAVKTTSAVEYILLVNFFCRYEMESPKFMGSYDTREEAEQQLAQYRKENPENAELSAEIIQTRRGAKAEEYSKSRKSFYY